MRSYLIGLCLLGSLLQATETTEPTNAEEAAAEKARESEILDRNYEAWVATLSPEARKWEQVLQSELGNFYLPLHKKGKVAGKSSAWDFVEDDPELPRILLVGDSISRAYTLTVRDELRGIANVHRAPANCGPTATGLRKLEIWLGDGKWDYIHFNFGIHDRNTPLEDYRSRLEQLVARMKETGAVLLWANSTPLPEVAGKFTAQSMVERNTIAAEVMTKNGIPINDLFGAITPKLDDFQKPGDCHFHEPGNRFLGETVASFLLKQFEN